MVLLMHLGIGEVLIILVVALLVFGPNKLPQLGDALGKAIRNFKRAASQDDAIDVAPEKPSPSRLSESTGAEPLAPAQPAASTKDEKKGDLV